jgi:hypothetical protein
MTKVGPVTSINNNLPLFQLYGHAKYIWWTCLDLNCKLSIKLERFGIKNVLIKYVARPAVKSRLQEICTEACFTGYTLHDGIGKTQVIDILKKLSYPQGFKIQ